MKSRILIAPNSFKECADSVTIAELLSDNLSQIKNTQLIVKPISDGGDGFLNVCRYYFGGELKNYRIPSTYDESEFECPILYIESKQKIYIESADVLGLKVVPPKYRNPLRLSSKGLGELLLRIEEEVQKGKLKVDKVYIGFGGTATIDLGLGMMSKLGLKLYDAFGKELNVIPENFDFTDNINYKPIKLSFEIKPIVDVTNPLLGSNGGIKVYGKQKGADDGVILYLERSFNHILKLFETKGLRVSSKLLSGAGGGIAASFQMFYNSNLILSSEFIIHYLGLEDCKNTIDYIITGEGEYNAQSDSGKGVKTIIEMFRSNAKKIFLVCGKISGSNVKDLIPKVIPIELQKYFDNEIDSIKYYKSGITKACGDIINEINF